jgi:signal peptidase I
MMKKISFNCKMIILFLLLYILTYNFILSFNISSALYNFCFWIFMLFISYILLGYTKNRSITKKQTIQFILIYCLLYFILIYFLGIITGFNTVPYSHKIISIIKNIFLPITLIISKEFIRYMLIFKNRFSKRNVLLINFIFTLIDIVTVIDLYQFNTALLVFTFIGEVVLTSIYNNSLESLISYNNGPIPPIIFRLIMELYVYFVPIIPNLGIYLNTVITVCLPVLLILCLNKLCYNYKNVSKKKVSISKMYITIPLVIIFISVCSLVSGIFKYKIVAVASNSMIPVFERGDAVIYEKVNSVSNLNVGDILVFEQNDVIYIHRIVEIVYKNKEYNIYTKGDNNAYQDDFITTSKDVVGVVRQEVKYIGYPTIWVTELFER